MGDREAARGGGATAVAPGALRAVGHRSAEGDFALRSARYGQRTMLEIVNQLDGFDARGNIKVLMATNRPDTLGAALMRPGRLDRKVEFGLPDLEGRAHILKIHSKRINCARAIRFELIARLCPNTT